MDLAGSDGWTKGKRLAQHWPTGVEMVWNNGLDGLDPIKESGCPKRR
jgi:hypothetical protein